MFKIFEIKYVITNNFYPIIIIISNIFTLIEVYFQINLETIEATNLRIFNLKMN